MRRVRHTSLFFFFFQAEDGIRDLTVTGVQTCALPICKLRVHQACDLLAISEQRHRQLRAQMLQAAVAGVGDQPSGRPARAPESAEVVALRQQVVQLQRELQAARVYEEIALVLPQVDLTLSPAEVRPAAPPPAPRAGAAPASKKKRRSRPRRNRR